MENNFFGKWILLSEKSEYAHGTPPLEATYEFKIGKNESIDISIEWVDQDGEKFSLSYNAIPDGQKREYENPQIADEVMSEFESNNQLNSYTFKNGKAIAFASRIINEKGIMEVLQRFYTPEGKSFDNIQFYKREIMEE